MSTIIDLSPTLSPALPCWPGDQPFAREVQAVPEGSPITVSSIRTSLHMGAHVDAPCHVLPGAPTIDQLPPELFLGPCEVFQIQTISRARIWPERLPHAPRASRVLIGTNTWPDRSQFTEDFAGLSVELVDYLDRQGVRLVGIDTPSVDLFGARELDVHRALAERGMVALEGICLDGVAPGLYELSALPLKVGAGDGSPVRAVLTQK